MDKDNNYWNLHKDIYIENFSNLAPEIRNLITNNPDSKEAKLLNIRVKRELDKALLARTDKARVI